MEIVYLYCVFSYLFLLGALIQDPNNESTSAALFDSNVVVAVALVLSPVIMPIWLGYELNKLTSK